MTSKIRPPQTVVVRYGPSKALRLGIVGLILILPTLLTAKGIIGDCAAGDRRESALACFTAKSVLASAMTGLSIGACFGGLLLLFFVTQVRRLFLQIGPDRITSLGMESTKPREIACQSVHSFAVGRQGIFEVIHLYNRQGKEIFRVQQFYERWDEIKKEFARRFNARSHGS